MDEFFGRYRNLSVLLAVVFAQIILLGYQVRTDRGSSLLREWTVRTITPVTKGVRGLTQWAGSGWENYFWLVDTKQDNDRLRRQLAQLKLENVGLKSSLARFEREETLGAYQQDLASTTILAQVIGKGANSNSREIFISRGLDAGVAAGMPVITPDGIVGKVQASYPGAALVMLISDPEAGVGALLEQSRAPGILKGTGHAQCRLDYVSHEVEIASGETVYTSGDDRVFPKGLRIGEVVKLGRGTDFQEIRVRPFVQLDRIEEVLVITSGVHQDLPESPQAQPPQFLMPLPSPESNRLQADAAATTESPEPAQSGASAAPAEPVTQTETSGRLTDADRLRQYYQSIAAQQGHKIGYGGPGTVPEFNPERAAARQGTAGSAGGSGSAGASGSAAVPAGAPASAANAPGDEPEAGGSGEEDPAADTAAATASPTPAAPGRPAASDGTVAVPAAERVQAGRAETAGSQQPGEPSGRSLGDPGPGREAAAGGASRPASRGAGAAISRPRATDSSASDGSRP